jgi:hypothetical protein
VVPVKILTYAVTEEAFDGDLNPIRASVQLSMQVLSYTDVAPGDPAYPLFMAYQAAKESLAARGSVAGSSVADVLGVSPAAVSS